MNLLIIVEGDEPDKPPSSFFDEMMVDTVWLLYLSPRVKVFQYEKELRTVIKREVKIEIINPKKLVDFDYSRKVLLDFIASIPRRLRVADASLSEYLTIHGLNMWWTSGVVEATAYKRNLFQNLYYLSAVHRTLQKFDITAVWFQVEDISLENDLISMLDSAGIKYYQGPRSYQQSRRISSVKRRGPLNWLFSFATHLIYSISFKAICPKWVKPQKSKTAQKNIHLFWSYYPYCLRFKNDMPEDKIYGGLPSVLSKHLGGEAYYLCYLSPMSVFYPRQLARDVKKFWTHNFRFIPMDVFVSTGDMLRVCLSPERHWKYSHLKKVPEYREIFKIGGIDMFHTFDRAIRDSLIGNDAGSNLLHYHAFRRFARRYAKNIFQIVYPLEFHDWEVALISGVRDADKSIPLVGLQQSAPNPILLSFFFSPAMFKSKEDSYPLPDLILCSGDLYKELLLSNGIEPERVEVIGHIAGQYLNQLPLSSESKRQKRREINLPADRKICLVACSIDLSLTEGIIYLLKHVVTKLPEVLFLIKEHPQTPVAPLLCKYIMNELENVKSMQHPISTLLPLSDFFLSTSTSVSQEALRLGLPQVNLDVGGLPRANPLHLVPGLIADVENPGELLDFFLNTEKFRIPKEKSCLFIGDPGVEPCQKFLDIVVTRFHKDAEQR